MNRHTSGWAACLCLVLCLVLTGWMNAEDMKACRTLHSQSYCSAEVLR